MKLISLLVQHLFYIHGYFPAIIRSDLRTMLCHYSKSNGYHMINFTFRIISDFFRKQIARRKWILSAREQKTLTIAFDSVTIHAKNRKNLFPALKVLHGRFKRVH